VSADTEALLATVRHEANLIRTAVGMALAEQNIPRVPQWTQLTPASLDRIDDALDALAAELERVKQVNEHAYNGLRERMEAAYERVKAERDEYAAAVQHASDLQDDAETCRDQWIIMAGEKDEAIGAYMKQSSEQADEARKWRFRAESAEARLDKALSALRDIAEGNVALPHEQVAAVTLAEIEGEA
jgi:hypothetical protein